MCGRPIQMRTNRRKLAGYVPGQQELLALIGPADDTRARVLKSTYI